MRIADGKNLRMADAGEVLTLDYASALARHEGESWFGVAVGFRMLQAAGKALSEHRLWDRNDLIVVSGHPGNGVRDTVEYVTRCASRGRFRVESASAKPGCSRNMSFAWEVGDGASIAVLRLRGDFVPDELYELLDCRGTPQESPGDASRFAELKHRLAEKVWDEPLVELFRVKLLDAGLVGHA